MLDMMAYDGTMFITEHLAPVTWEDFAILQKLEDHMECLTSQPAHLFPVRHKQYSFFHDCSHGCHRLMRHWRRHHNILRLKTIQNHQTELDGCRSQLCKALRPNARSGLCKATCLAWAFRGWWVSLALVSVRIISRHVEPLSELLWNTENYYMNYWQKNQRTIPDAWLAHVLSHHRPRVKPSAHLLGVDIWGHIGIRGTTDVYRHLQTSNDCYLLWMVLICFDLGRNRFRVSIGGTARHCIPFFGTPLQWPVTENRGSEAQAKVKQWMDGT